MLRVGVASIILFLLSGFSVLAQTVSDPEAAGAETTAGEIERLRKQKLQNLRSASLPWLHRTILYVRENRIPEKITYGYKGIRPRFGTPGPGSGFGTGVEYYRPNLGNERYTVRSSVTASLLQFFMIDGEFEARRLAGKRLCQRTRVPPFFSGHRFLCQRRRQFSREPHRLRARRRKPIYPIRRL